MVKIGYNLPIAWEQLGSSPELAVGQWGSLTPSDRSTSVKEKGGSMILILNGLEYYALHISSNIAHAAFASLVDAQEWVAKENVHGDYYRVYKEG